MPPSIESSVLSITINHNRQRKNLTKRSPYHPCGSYNIGNEQFYQDQVVRTATILPSFYFKGGKLSSFITTSVSGLSSSLQERHLMCCCSSATYSLLGSRNDDVTVQCTETVSMQNKHAVNHTAATKEAEVLRESGLASMDSGQLDQMIVE